MTSINRVKWKRRLGRVYGSLRQTASQRRIILLYHSVGSGPWAVDTAMFDNQLEMLNRVAEVVSLPELLQPDDGDGLKVALTFDDGYVSLSEIAEPLMSARNMTATVFLNTGHIGDDEHQPSRPDLGHYPGERFLSWQDVAQLQDAGWIIGSHGVHHLDLTEEPAQVVHDELVTSKAVIAERTGRACEIFSYTWGRHSARLREQVRTASYRCAVAGGHAPLNTDFDPFAVPRMNVASEYTVADLEAIVSGDWDYLDWLSRGRSWVQ